MEKHLIIYDIYNIDSLICASLLKYYYVNNGISEDNVDFIEYNSKKIYINSSEYNKYVSVALCECMLDVNVLKNIYEIFNKNLIVFLYNQSYINKIYKLNSYVIGEYNNDRSATLNLYKYLYDSLDIAYKNAKQNMENSNIPVEYIYISAYYTYKFSEFIEKVETTETETINYILTLDKVRNYAIGLMDIFNDIISNQTSETVNIIDIAYEYVKYVQTDNIEENSILSNFLNNIKTENIINSSISKTAKLDNETLQLFNKYSITNIKVGNRSAIVLFTYNDLGNTVLNDDLIKSYDTVVLIHNYSNDSYILNMYKINHKVTIADETNITDEEREQLSLNSFNCGNYLHYKYNGYGTDSFGSAKIKEKDFITILKTKVI